MLYEVITDARRNGWAIEVRLCAEDPVRGYMPQAGPVLRWAPPRITSYNVCYTKLLRKITEIVAVTIGGAKGEETLRTALAFGADRAIHIKDDRNNFV